MKYNFQTSLDKNSLTEQSKHLILWSVSQFCRLPIPLDRIRLSDKFYFKLRPKQTICPLRVGRYYVMVDLAELQPRLIYFQYFERDLIKFIKKYLKRDQICLDVGANVGYLSAVMAQSIGKNGKVYALEPAPQVFKFVDKLAQSSGGIIEAFPLAASDKKGTIEFYVEESEHMLSTCVKDLHSAGAKKIFVEATTVDEFCLEQNIRPDFIKIDVEGAEPLVLKGMQGLLQSGLRPIILCELKPWTYDSFGMQAEEVVNLIMQHGYRVYIVGSKANLIETSLREICKSKIDVNAIFISSGPASLSLYDQKTATSSVS